MTRSSDWSHRTCSKFFLVTYILSFYILSTTTRSSSSHWKLVLDESSGRHVIVPSIEELSPTTEKPYVQVRHSPLHGRNNNNNGTAETNSTVTPLNPNIPSWAAKEDEELVFHILTTTVLSPRGSWTKNGQEVYCSQCPMMGRVRVGGGRSSSLDTNDGDLMEDGLEVLDCGRPANFTYYDQLVSVLTK